MNLTLRMRSGLALKKAIMAFLPNPVHLSSDLLLKGQ
jgi:hypothetical protein